MIIIILLISLLALGIFAFFISKFQRNDGPESGTISGNVNSSCKNSEYCCGAHEICEEGKKKRININFDYYEDEELDRFRNRLPGSYTPEEIQEFREVLETLQAGEIEDWLKSLAARNIRLPEKMC